MLRRRSGALSQDKMRYENTVTGNLHTYFADGTARPAPRSLPAAQPRTQKALACRRA